eukprot:Rhum_TRINITY_DN14987_c8_g1::Rhum_TRINITY_DN14987_c8_g1_i1::g.131700::m.131700
MEIYVQIAGREPVAVAVDEDDTDMEGVAKRAAAALGLREGLTGDLARADGTGIVSDPRELSSGAGGSGGGDPLTFVNPRHPSWRRCVKEGTVMVPDAEYCKPPHGEPWPLMGSYLTEILGRDSLRLPEPEGDGLRINMMPFRYEWAFERTGLPDELKRYWDVLFDAHGDAGSEAALSLRRAMRKERGTVCYLSIHESRVEEGEHQRRPGLHTDFSGRFLADPLRERERPEQHRDAGRGQYVDYERMHPWGWSRGHMDGGIYVMSNMDATCAAWNCTVDVEESDDADIIGRGGDIEHLRSYLPDAARVEMKANRLYWMTDRTPHETLPAQRSGWRQWVRVVTSGVGVWFADHSTPNPKGVVPDPEITTVIVGDKFGDPRDLRVLCPDPE